MSRVSMYVSLVIAVIIASSVVNGQTTLCTGYPKMYNGLPCASTTRYWDGQMGACGCGTGNSDPFSWQWTSLTAAASAPLFGSGTWCGSGCGKCYKLTPTGVGASPLGTGATTTTSVIAKVTNLCPNEGNEQWCAYDINSYGYDAHFDLMDYNMDGLVTAMGWNNPEVTYEEVDCASNGYLNWGCECASNGTTTAAAATSAPTNAAATSAPSKATSAPSKATSAPAKATTTTTKAAATSAPSKATTAPAKATTTTTQAATTTTTQAATTTTNAPATSTSTGSDVSIQINGGSSTWWIGFSIIGTNDIAKVEIMDSGSVKSFVTMGYQGNAYYNMYSYQPTQQLVAPISLRFTSTSGTVSTASNIITSFQAIVIDTKLVL